MAKIAINGFGRIGRLIYRSILERNMLDGKVEVVAVNDVVTADNLAYLLKYDSIHGTLPFEVTTEGEDFIKISKDGQEISRVKALGMKVEPSELPWGEMDIDVVIECTGMFTKKDQASGHLTAGAKKVVISAPSDDDVPTLLCGVNESSYEGQNLISNASCTTNCLGAIVQVLMREGIGISEGLVTTVHAYTADQALQDAPHKDYRRGRAAAANIVPTTSGSAKSMGVIFPQLNGKLTGMALRVPVTNGSIIDLTFKPDRDSSLGEINEKMKAASQTYLKGILDYTEDPVVSSDFIHSPFSAIYDASASVELNSGFFKLLAWYDNEWGYSNRMVDLVKTVIG